MSVYRTRQRSKSPSQWWVKCASKVENSTFAFLNGGCNVMLILHLECQHIYVSTAADSLVPIPLAIYIYILLQRWQIWIAASIALHIPRNIHWAANNIMIIRHESEWATGFLHTDGLLGYPFLFFQPIKTVTTPFKSIKRKSAQ